MEVKGLGLYFRHKNRLYIVRDCMDDLKLYYFLIERTLPPGHVVILNNPIGISTT